MGTLEENPKGTADYCTACTSCITTCPVTAATSKFRGPKLVGPAQSRLNFAEPDAEASLEYCSNCKNCDISCPSGVAVSTLNMLQRGEYYRSHPHPLRDHILAHGEQMIKLARKLPFGSFFANLGASIGRKTGMFKMIGIASKRPMPQYASKSFLQQFRSIKQTSYPDKVVFFPGCFINENDPDVGIAFVKVMQQNHYEVIVDENFVCCGSPLVVTGYLDEAQANARKNTALIRKWTEQGYPILTCCTSCSLMLKQEYAELFDLPDLHENAKHVYDACEFLLDLHEKDRFDQTFSGKGGNYIYHAPCHLRVQGIGTPALELLSLVPNVVVENADAGCCGISGNYGFKEDKYEISMQVGQELFRRIKESSASKVISDCGTCRMQIEHGSGFKTVHPIEVLSAAYHA
jgi:glycerol-3-phosphate dehydrogenase subunit C